MNEEIEKYKASIDTQEKIQIQKTMQKQRRQKKEQSLLEEVTLHLLAMDFYPKQVEISVKKVFKKLGEDIEKSSVLKEAVKFMIDKDEKKAESTAKKKKAISLSDNYLARLMTEARNKKKSVHEYFLDKGVIKPPLDEIWEDEEDVALVSHTVS